MKQVTHKHLPITNVIKSLEGKKETDQKKKGSTSLINEKSISKVPISRLLCSALLLFIKTWARTSVRDSTVAS